MAEKKGAGKAKTGAASKAAKAPAALNTVPEWASTTAVAKLLLKTAIAEGKYIKAEEATRDLADFMAMFKKFAMNIPPRAVKSIAGYADPQTARAMERAMRKELEDMLAVFVDAAEIGPEEAEP